MNFKQRVAIFVGLLVEAAMLLYPPWKVPGWPNDIYRPLFSPAPRWIDYSYYAAVRVGVIDTQRLGFQCLIVALAITGIVVLFGHRKRFERPTH